MGTAKKSNNEQRQTLILKLWGMHTTTRKKKTKSRFSQAILLWLHQKLDRQVNVKIQFKVKNYKYGSLVFSHSSDRELK